MAAAKRFQIVTHAHMGTQFGKNMCETCVFGGNFKCFCVVVHVNRRKKKE